MSQRGSREKGLVRLIQAVCLNLTWFRAILAREVNITKVVTVLYEALSMFIVLWNAMNRYLSIYLLVSITLEVSQSSLVSSSSNTTV
jgi:hypothetical protein